MKKLLASITAISSIALAVLIVPQVDAATFHSVQWYDAQTNIASRWENERQSVEARVHDNYTDDDTGETDEDGKAANLFHIGSRLVTCIRDLSTCKAK